MKKLFVCALAVAMVFAFTAPTMAADWNFYGSARFDTFSHDNSKEVTGTGYSDADTQWTTASNARIGANVSAGDVGGRFEYGPTPNLRLLYGTWNFGAGTLIVGQDYTPIAEFYSNQVDGGDADLLAYGMAYDGRRSQIKLRFGAFDIAFIQPNVVGPTTGVTTTTTAGVVTGVALTAFPAATDTDTTLPKIAMSYKFSTDMFSVKPYLGWQSFEFNNGTGDNTESLTSLVYGVGGKVNFGPAYIAANIMGGTNLGNYGLASASAAGAAWTGTQLKDNTTIAYAAVIGFKASDMFTVEGGYGYTHSEIDFATKVEDEASSYYVNCTINLAPGVMLVPEIGKYDNGEWKTAGMTVDKGDVTYFGAKWQIDF
jgi:hypothetical protein